ncbi:MAG: response regulator [Proteobacteria bacterium]|nr:response regulator [Pseudomonadota bacterium]
MNAFKFLLVDDEKLFIEAVAQRLRLRGFKVDCAFSGKEALEMLEKENTVDVVVLDINMPDLDGIETVAKLKTKCPLVEVVMVTGHAKVKTAIKSLKIGAFDYLTKPFDLDDLISKATQAASRKKEREAKILSIKTKPYISERERNKLISDILST